ncbi:unnamed protein product [Lampetra planeri]
MGRGTRVARRERGTQRLHALKRRRQERQGGVLCQNLASPDRKDQRVCTVLLRCHLTRSSCRFNRDIPSRRDSDRPASARVLSQAVLLLSAQPRAAMPKA